MANEILKQFDIATEVLDPVYLPFSAATLAKHFAPVGIAPRTADDYLRYYLQSAARYRKFLAENSALKSLPLAALRIPCQIEKDEKFWTVACWLSLYYCADRLQALTRLMVKCFGERPPMKGGRTWQECFDGDLRLYFEAHLPSPTAYKTWLKQNVRHRNLIPYVLRAAARTGNRDFEGATHADALLVNADNGFAVLIEAKVLSDISCQVSFDVARNQIARTIDVMLEPNPLLQPPLCKRDPESTLFVLQSPDIFKANPHTRFYGWLLREYQQNPTVISRDLPHRKDVDWAAVASRIGWVTWEDCDAAVPGACRWLAIDSPAAVDRPERMPAESISTAMELPYTLDVNFDRARLESLIRSFEGAAKRQIDLSLARNLRRDLLESSPVCLSRQTVLQLARWCKTDNPVYWDGMEVARKISELLFGCVVDRQALNT